MINLPMTPPPITPIFKFSTFIALVFYKCQNVYFNDVKESKNNIIYFHQCEYSQKIKTMDVGVCFIQKVITFWRCIFQELN